MLAVETQQRREKLPAVSVNTQDAQGLESKALALNFKRLLLHLPLNTWLKRVNRTVKNTGKYRIFPSFSFPCPFTNVRRYLQIKHLSCSLSFAG